MGWGEARWSEAPENSHLCLGLMEARGPQLCLLQPWSPILSHGPLEVIISGSYMSHKSASLPQAPQVQQSWHQTKPRVGVRVGAASALSKSGSEWLRMCACARACVRGVGALGTAQRAAQPQQSWIWWSLRWGGGDWGRALGTGRRAPLTIPLCVPWAPRA